MAWGFYGLADAEAFASMKQRVKNLIDAKLMYVSRMGSGTSPRPERDLWLGVFNSVKVTIVERLLPPSFLALVSICWLRLGVSWILTEDILT